MKVLNMRSGVTEVFPVVKHCIDSDPYPALTVVIYESLAH